MSSDQPTVVVVDDERDLADIFSSQITSKYSVRTVYDGQSALEMIDNEVDVVLLDRRMPTLSGNDVLDRIRAEGYECKVIMITAVVPDFDIIEMPFDDYLCKPIDKQTLLDAIDQQLTAKKYHEKLSELYQVKSKLALLEAEKSVDDLEASTEYQQLKQRTVATQTQAESLVSELGDFESAFKAIDRH